MENLNSITLSIETLTSFLNFIEGFSDEPLNITNYKIIKQSEKTKLPDSLDKQGATLYNIITHISDIEYSIDYFIENDKIIIKEFQLKEKENSSNKSSFNKHKYSRITPMGSRGSMDSIDSFPELFDPVIEEEQVPVNESNIEVPGSQPTMPSNSNNITNNLNNEVIREVQNRMRELIANSRRSDSNYFIPIDPIRNIFNSPITPNESHST